MDIAVKPLFAERPDDFALPPHGVMQNGRRGERTMTCVKLAIATTDYDHFRDFRLGSVRAEGIDHTWLRSAITKYSPGSRSTASGTSVSFPSPRPSPSLHGTIPISSAFRSPARACSVFRRSTSTKKAKSRRPKISRAKGRLAGMGAYRGGLHARLAQRRARCRLQDVHGTSRHNGSADEKVELNLPYGLTLTRVADHSLSDMLANGDIDCALIARPPDCFRQGHPDVMRLFPEYWEMEEALQKDQSVADHAHRRHEEIRP